MQATHASRSIQGVLVLADDLTGAADAAVALAGAERDAEVVLDVGGVTRACSGIVSVDLDTRRMTADAASQTVADAVALVANDSSARQIFKKIDSTLRGHLGAELAAMARALPSHRGARRVLYVVAPAHPELGRTMEGGRLHVHGQPRDGQIDLVNELNSHGFHCAMLPTTLLDTGDRDMLRQSIEVAASESTDAPVALVCDTRSVAELREIVAAVYEAKVHCVWVGSAGLAQALSHTINDCSVSPSHHAFSLPRQLNDHVPRRRGMIFVVGSFSDVARAQVKQLIRSGVTQIAVGAESPGPDFEAATRARIETALLRGDDVVLCIDPAAEVQLARALALARCLAVVVAPSLPQLDALVICGGDTSRALFRQIGVEHLEVKRSTEPGATHATIAMYPHLPIILKAGAFGDDQVLVRLRHQLGHAFAMTHLKGIQ